MTKIQSLQLKLKRINPPNFELRTVLAQGLRCALVFIGQKPRREFLSGNRKKASHKALAISSSILPTSNGTSETVSHRIKQRIRNSRRPWHRFKLPIGGQSWSSISSTSTCDTFLNLAIGYPSYCPSKMRSMRVWPLLGFRVRSTTQMMPIRERLPV